MYIKKKNENAKTESARLQRGSARLRNLSRPHIYLFFVCCFRKGRSHMSKHPHPCKRQPLHTHARTLHTPQHVSNRRSTQAQSSQPHQNGLCELATSSRVEEIICAPSGDRLRTTGLNTTLIASVVLGHSRPKHSVVWGRRTCQAFSVAPGQTRSALSKHSVSRERSHFFEQSAVPGWVPAAISSASAAPEVEFVS